MRITVLFFASARELAGDVSKVELELDDGNDKSPSQPPDTKRLREALASRYPSLAPLVLDEDTLTLALNERYVEPGQVLPLKDGDTVALIPPISGG